MIMSALLCFNRTGEGPLPIPYSGFTLQAGTYVFKPALTFAAKLPRLALRVKRISCLLQTNIRRLVQSWKNNVFRFA